MSTEKEDKSETKANNDSENTYMNTLADNRANYIRRGADRRKSNERRDDPRVTGKRSLQAWIKSLINPRVGVDRRKGNDRRKSRGEYQDSQHSSLLTAEELKELLD